MFLSNYTYVTAVHSLLALVEQRNKSRNEKIKIIFKAAIFESCLDKTKVNETILLTSSILIFSGAENWEQPSSSSWLSAFPCRGDQF